MIGARVIALGIGYLFGLFQTGYLYGKSQGIDIRSEGSGNAGTTNSLRVLGIKAGLITFAGDLCKAILAVLLVKVLFRNAYPDAVKILELYAGFGAVLGHNFPFYVAATRCPPRTSRARRRSLSNPYRPSGSPMARVMA